SRASRRARAPHSRSAARRARRGSGPSSARPDARAAREVGRALARRHPPARGVRAPRVPGRQARVGNYRWTVRAELTTEIARTPEDVFSYLTDVSHLPDWQAGVKSATQRDGKIEESRSMFGRELQTTFEIVDEEQPRLFTLRAL